MFFAYTASLRSADLSRQVGAVIVKRDGQMVATGCNEVPHPGGGTHWEGGEGEDYRDWKKGRDYNVKTIASNIEELTSRLRKEGMLSENFLNMPDDEQAIAIKKALKGTGISSAIEYGRVVHAEMHAISTAAASGIPTNDTNLYCTTFPCHMCARHIIASGISKVTFIEPYPKSLTKELYEEMVVIDQNVDGQTGESAIHFDAFMGVAPCRYISFFHWGDTKRKDPYGMSLVWNPETAIPKVTQTYATNLHKEIIFSKDLVEILQHFAV